MTLTVDLDNFPAPLNPFLEQGEQRIILAGGCFWCTEAVFLQLNGVLSVVSGYAGDSAELANYDAVCSGTTNHAEVIEVRYDSSLIGLGEILKIFFSIAHDPTQLNRQGNDIGRQYRSAVFYENDAQRQYVADYINQLNHAVVFAEPIATSLEPLQVFFRAEDYHQDFARRNPMQPYVQYAATPKVSKLRQIHPDKLRH